MKMNVFTDSKSISFSGICWRCSFGRKVALIILSAACTLIQARYLKVIPSEYSNSESCVLLPQTFRLSWYLSFSQFHTPTNINTVLFGPTLTLMQLSCNIFSVQTRCIFHMHKLHHHRTEGVPNEITQQIFGISIN